MANDTKHSAPTEDVSNGPTVEVTTADELEVRHASNAADEDEEINADTAGIVSAQPPPKKPKNKKKSGNPGSKRGLVSHPKLISGGPETTDQLTATERAHRF